MRYMYVGEKGRRGWSLGKRLFYIVAL